MMIILKKAYIYHFFLSKIFCISLQIFVAEKKFVLSSDQKSFIIANFEHFGKADVPNFFLSKFGVQFVC